MSLPGVTKLEEPEIRGNKGSSQRIKVANAGVLVAAEKIHKVRSSLGLCPWAEALTGGDSLGVGLPANTQALPPGGLITICLQPPTRASLAFQRGRWYPFGE